MKKILSKLLKLQKNKQTYYTWIKIISLQQQKIKKILNYKNHKFI